MEDVAVHKCGTQKSGETPETLAHPKGMSGFDVGAGPSGRLAAQVSVMAYLRTQSLGLQTLKVL